MDFRFTEEQDELYRSIVDFARSALEGFIEEADDPAIRFREWWRLCGEQGILGMLVPEEYGGLGLDPLTAARGMEALGYGCRDMGFCFSVAAHIYACIVPTLHFAPDAARERYLPSMVSGETIVTHCVTEPGAGSDAFGMKMRAEKDGPDYILNGSKCFSSNGPLADLFLVHAVTRPGAGFLGISAFLVERETPGLSVSKPYKKIGLEGAPLGDVFLEDCRVDGANLVGREGQGGAIFTHSMNWERACLFATYLGAMARQLEETIRYARQRKQFGKAIKEYQAVSHRIADMKVRLEAGRLLAYRAAWALGEKSDWKPSLDSSMAKLFVSEAAVQSGLDAIQIHGGMGIMSESGVERHLRDAIPGRIFSGTSEIQRSTIAKNLGL